MKNGEWELAEYIYVLLLEEDQQADVDKSCEKVNRYIALKNLYGVETIEEEIRNIDVSALRTQFSIAKHALLDEFDDVSELLEEVIDNEIPVSYIKEWPLLNQYRESPQYTLFVEKHKEQFETKTFGPDNETIDDAEDDINGLGV